jgi:hypothetical protein
LNLFTTEVCHSSVGQLQEVSLPKNGWYTISKTKRNTFDNLVWKIWWACGGKSNVQKDRYDGFWALSKVGDFNFPCHTNQTHLRLFVDTVISIQRQQPFKVITQVQVTLTITSAIHLKRIASGYT